MVYFGSEIFKTTVILKFVSMEPLKDHSLFAFQTGYSIYLTIPTFRCKGVPRCFLYHSVCRLIQNETNLKPYEPQVVSCKTSYL